MRVLSVAVSLPRQRGRFFRRSCMLSTSRALHSLKTQPQRLLESRLAMMSCRWCVAACKPTTERGTGCGGSALSGMPRERASAHSSPYTITALSRSSGEGAGGDVSAAAAVPEE